MACDDPDDGPLNGAVVLLVEDEVLVRMAVADWLRDTGFEVVEAACGAEGLAVLTSGMPIDLLVTDITMPGEPDGIGLARMFRSERPGVPVVFASARLPQDAEGLADLCVAKPYAPSELVAAVAALLEEAWHDNRGKGRDLRAS